MRPDQLELIVSTGTPSLSPDGRHLVVAISRPDFATDGYTGQLWLVPTDRSSPPRRLTRGYADTSPRFSPDGMTIAFLRSAPGSAPQLAVLPVDGGEARVLTDRDLGVRGFNWSPDSAWLCFTSAEPEPGRYGSVDGVSASQEDPRLVTGPDYRINGLGYTADRLPRLFEIAVPDLDEEPVFEPLGRVAASRSDVQDQDRHDDGRFPRAYQLTDGEREAHDPVYAADSRHVFFTTTPASRFGKDLRSAVAVVEARPASGEAGASGDGSSSGPVRLVAGGTEDTLSFDGPCISRNGEWLYLLGSDLGESGQEFVASNTGVYVLSAPTAVRQAAAGWERPAEGLHPRLLTDLEAMNCSGGPLRLSGQDNVLALAEDRGRTVLVWMTHHGQPEVLVEMEGSVVGASEAGGTLAVSYSTPDSPGQVGIQHRGSGLTILFDPNQALREKTTVARGAERTYPSADGSDGASVHGWVFVPEGEGPHPVLLNIHGGPYAQYTHDWFDETQVLVEAGYAVVMCNPRGSNGYGAEHGAAVKHAMGTVDLQDILGFLDSAVDEFGSAGSGVIDEQRLGVMGGSYGGLMTALITANDHRFTAAIVERGYLDPLSALGSSDIGWFFTPEYFGTDRATVERQSPLAQVHRVRTPTLVIHSEDDLRCPIEHAQRYYHALWSQGVESELLIFPGENHELSRSGTPWHRRSRFEHQLRWWARFLPTGRNHASRSAESEESADSASAADTSVTSK